MFEYFYHEILRKTIISFGTLFNGIEIRHQDSDDAVIEKIKVPLAYGPTQKFLARLEQSSSLSKGTQITLPRMSFEFIGLQYDPTRKVTTTQTFTTVNPDDKTEVKRFSMPVPYTMAFELSIYTKLNDDMLQIVEQILPYFQPSYNLTVNLVETIGEKRDIPVVIENISMQDDYEGDFSTRRSLYYTIRFSAKTYLYDQFLLVHREILSKRFKLVTLQEIPQILLQEISLILSNQEQPKITLAVQSQRLHKTSVQLPSLSKWQIPVEFRMHPSLLLTMN